MATGDEEVMDGCRRVVFVCGPMVGMGTIS